MNKKKIVQTLKKLLPQIKVITTKYPANIPLDENLRISKLREELKIIGPLKKVLQKENEFKKPKNPSYNNGRGYGPFRSNEAALFLCHQGGQFGATNAVNKLIKIFSHKETDLICLMALRGINCKNKIQLTKKVKMVPLSQLPISNIKVSLEQQNPIQLLNISNFSAFNSLSMPFYNIEKAFLITTIKVKPVLFDNRTKKVGLSPAYLEATSCLNNIRLCLTAIGICSPLEEFSWVQFKDEALEDAVHASSSRSFKHIEIIPRKLRESKKIQEKEAALFIKSFLKLDGKFKKRIVIALERLNQSMRRQTVGEKAVEISIALETLLLGEEKGDNIFKTSLRSGIVISPNLSDRRECRKIIKKIYGYRSDLVHKGENSNNVSNSVDITERAIHFTAKIITILIKYGKDPEWSELELSGKPLK